MQADFRQYNHKNRGNGGHLDDYKKLSVLYNGKITNYKTVTTYNSLLLYWYYEILTSREGKMYIELLIAQVLSVIYIKPFHFPGFRRLSSIRRSTKHSLFGTHQRKKNGKRGGPLRAMLNFIFWIAFFSIISSVLYFLLYLIKVWNLSLILISNFNFR